MTKAATKTGSGLGEVQSGMSLFLVRVTPRASRDEVGPLEADGTLRVRVTAAPVEGAANSAVTKLLADALGLAPRDIVLVSGATARIKRFDVPLGAATIRARLDGAKRA